MIKLLFCLMTLTAFAMDEEKIECINTKVKTVFNQKEEIKNEDICFAPLNDVYYIVSKSCSTKSCPSFEIRQKKITIKNYNSVIGSPGYKICQAIDGVGQPFEYLQKNGEWRSTSRCVLPSSTKEIDFIEMGYLMDELSRNIEVPELEKKKSDDNQSKEVKDFKNTNKSK